LIFNAEAPLSPSHGVNIWRHKPNPQPTLSSNQTPPPNPSKSDWIQADVA